MIPLDHPPLPCVLERTRAEDMGLTSVFDQLIDAEPDSPSRQTYAVKVGAKRICDSCSIKGTCHSVLAGEDWVKMLSDMRAAPTKRPQCGTRRGANLHYEAGEHTCRPCSRSKRATA